MADLSLPDVPLFVSSVTEPPLVLLTMGRDHKLFYEAYNDASDLDEDGQLDIGYKPAIDYYGYFDSFKCYVYDSGDGRFEPSTATADKKCAGASEWSGDWLNYVTTARMDAIRKVLYGGNRSVDNSTTTVLERTHVPQDAHSWGKEYTSIAVSGYDLQEYTPLSLPSTGKRHLFANTTLRNSGSGEPRLRVLENSDYRVWEWLSIERPVAGDR
jgi:type IV pilus assembly protein PilY1